MDYLEIVTNQATADLEEVELEGRKHWRVPTVAITEGVHNGSKGPILYLSEDGEKNPSAWDHKPAIVYHPEQTVHGPMTACSTTVINKQKIGIPLETKWEDKRLRMNVYLDKDRTREVDDRVYNAILKKEKVEVSTGLSCDIEWVKGVHNGEEYVGIARNWRPDHLAILPDEKGACSIAKGAGLLQNSEGGEVKLAEPVVELIRKVVSELVSNKQESQMTKKEKVDAILNANKESFTEADRESLMNQDEKFLDKLIKTKTVEVEVKVEKKVENNQQVENKDAKKVETVVATLSPEDQRILNRAKAKEAAEKVAFIENILKNPANTFKKDYLETKDVEELEALSRLATVTSDANVENTSRGTFMGSRFIAAAGGPDTVYNNEPDAGLSSDDYELDEVESKK